MLAARKSPRESEKNAASVDEDLEPVDMLVDLLIGYLENASAFMRSVASEAFSRITPMIQESTINLIVTVSETTIRWAFAYSDAVVVDSAIGTTRSSRVGRRRRVGLGC